MLFRSAALSANETQGALFPISPRPRLRERLARNVGLLQVMRGWSQEVLAQEAGLERTCVGGSGAGVAQSDAGEYGEAGGGVGGAGVVALMG